MTTTSASSDSDVIVTGPLDDLVRSAEAGTICAGADALETRWFAEWEDRLALAAPPRHEPYVNAGAVMWSEDRHPTFSDRWWECCTKVSLDRGAPPVHAGRQHEIMGYADQDVLNALLMSEVDAADLEVVPDATFAHGPTIVTVAVRDARRLACVVGDEPVTLLHSFGTPKPWLPAARPYVEPTAYVRRLRELVGGVDRRELVPWLRPGIVGRLWWVVLLGRVRARRFRHGVRRRRGRWGVRARQATT